MRSLFSFSTTLMNLLSYTRKFALMGLIFLVAIVVVMYSLFTSLRQDIRTSQQELEGIALISPLTKAVQLIQLHRGLSAVIFGGSDTMNSERVAKEKEVSDAINLIEERLPSSLLSSENWRDIKETWERLRKNELNLTVTENFTEHTSLINQVSFLEMVVADQYMLTFDPEISTYYLIDTAINKLPHALEHLGQMRAYGTGILAKKYIDEQQRLIMRKIMVKLEEALLPLTVNIEKTGRLNATTQNSLLAAEHAINDSAKRIIDLLESDILNGRFDTTPEYFMMDATDAINGGYGQIYNSLLPTIEGLLKARIARAENKLYTSISLSIVLFLIAAYFMVGVYKSISDNIKSLAHSALAYSNGDLSQRIKLDTHDELSLVGDSFNEMADRFNAMLEERKLAEEELAKSANELRITATAFNSQEGILITDKDGVILKVNQSLTETTGFSTEELLGQKPRILSSGRHDADFYRRMWESVSRTGLWRGEIWDRRKDGEIRPKWLTITAVKGDDGIVTNYIGSLIDITERKAAEEKIQDLAFYDHLTHLPNRRLLMDRLQQALTSCTRSRLSGALLFIDLDNFKVLNDTLGHYFGDLLLTQVAQRLKSCIREGDTVARLGGDEFVVILEMLGEDTTEAASQTETIGEKILDSLSKPYRLNSHEYRSSTSIGATLFNGQLSSPMEELMKQADIAMYQAKKAGRNTLRFFDPKMQASISARALLEEELRNALENQQFRLYYQIQVDSSLQPLGAEALIRWLHPVRGLVFPMQFIPLAEENGLILPIGLWVLETACIQIRAWQQDMHTRDLVLAVNVSAHQFRQADFVDQLRATVQRNAINPMRLKLELTESLMLENIEATISIMSKLNEIGVQLSLDDFGTGYSSLQYLKRLPLNQLKIDRSFVRDIATDNNDKVIVRTIIAMAHNMNLNVIAEGVETEEQHQLLLDNGCTHYQGYLFGKPVPIDQFEDQLKRV